MTVVGFIKVLQCRQNFTTQYCALTVVYVVKGITVHFIAIKMLVKTDNNSPFDHFHSKYL